MVKKDIELYREIQRKAREAKGIPEYDITKEPLYDKHVEPILFSTVIVKCMYDMKEINSQKIEEFKKFLREDIPNLWSHTTAKTDKDEDIPVFYPSAWEGQFKVEHKVSIKISEDISFFRNPEIGSAQQYDYLELNNNKAIYVKRLHNTVVAKLENSDYLKSCEIIWGDLDDSLMADGDWFKEMEGWKEMETKKE